MITDTAILMLLADLQAQIVALRAENVALKADQNVETGAAQPVPVVVPTLDTMI